jgi:hypothetical protein
MAQIHINTMRPVAVVISPAVARNAWDASDPTSTTDMRAHFECYGIFRPMADATIPQRDCTKILSVLELTRFC